MVGQLRVYPPGITASRNIAKLGFRSALSKGERREYIDAVLCLMDKPPLVSTSEFPGVRNRYDDFVAVHINQTLSIHGTVRSKLYLGEIAYLIPFA